MNTIRNSFLEFQYCSVLWQQITVQLPTFLFISNSHENVPMSHCQWSTR